MRTPCGKTLGYCTNVHAGTSLEAIKSGLERYATAVRDRVAPDEPMGVGLWLPASAARDLAEDDAARAFADWLRARGLEAFTINGFPYGDFHRPVVKHDVYRPDWTTSERLEYTLDLMQILAVVTPEGGEGSISTLPVGWPDARRSDREVLAAAAGNLLEIARKAAEIEECTGRLVHVDLEPEPGCHIATSRELVAFFHDHLLVRETGEDVLRYLRVCHDVCHAAVMFEEQREVLDRYQAAGIKVGKVQLSCAVRAPFHAWDEAERSAALEQLGSFSEDRYLHQTVVRDGRAGAPVLFDDLPEALASASATGEWRVHYHVPVFMERFGLLESTQAELVTCLQILLGRPDVAHLEVETYAWEVLPEELRVADLAVGIASELEWTREVLAAVPGGAAP